MAIHHIELPTKEITIKTSSSDSPHITEVSNRNPMLSGSVFSLMIFIVHQPGGGGETHGE